MKTNTSSVLSVAAAISAITLVVITKVAAGNLQTVSVAAGYFVVAILTALTVLDYRAGPKSYVAR